MGWWWFGTLSYKFKLELIYHIVFKFSETSQNEITILLSTDDRLTYLIPYVWSKKKKGIILYTALDIKFYKSEKLSIKYLKNISFMIKLPKDKQVLI